MDKLILGFSEIFDRLHDAVIVTDLQGVVRNCNRAAEEVYGYNRAEFVGANIAVLYPELHRGNLRAMIDDVLDSGRADGEFLNVTKDGREIWIHLSASLLPDEASIPYGMVGFSIDITKSREIERENRETLERYRMAQEAAGVGLWHMEQKDGEWVLSWDEQSRAILQLPPGTKPSLEVFLGAVHPQDRWQLEHILRSPLKPCETYRCEYGV